MVLYRTIVLIFVLANLGVADELMVLEPTVPGTPSQVFSLPGEQNEWNYVISYNDGEPYYWCPRDAGDTMGVWFEPPTACTLIAIVYHMYVGSGTCCPPSVPHYVFVADIAGGTTLDTFMYYDTLATPGPSPLVYPPLCVDTLTFHPILDIDTFWIVPKLDIGKRPFFAGYAVSCHEWGILGDKDSYPPHHSLEYRQFPPHGCSPGWYCDRQTDFAIQALVRVYGNIGVKEEITTPATYCLNQNIPNPVTSTTTISYALHQSSRVSLKVYDVTGSLVKTLVNEKMDAGTYTVVWNLNNDFGTKIRSGIYFYRLTADNFTSTKKMIILK